MGSVLHGILFLLRHKALVAEFPQVHSITEEVAFQAIGGPTGGLGVRHSLPLTLCQAALSAVVAPIVDNGFVKLIQPKLAQ